MFVDRRMFLASHVRFCRTARHIVFLDIKRDQYLGIGGTTIDELAHVIDGWFEDAHLFNELSEGRTGGAMTGSVAVQCVPSELSDETQATIAAMLNSGMLTTTAPSRPPARDVDMSKPENALIDGYAQARRKIRFIDILRFAKSAALARALLR